MDRHGIENCTDECRSLQRFVDGFCALFHQWHHVRHHTRQRNLADDEWRVDVVRIYSNTIPVSAKNGVDQQPNLHHHLWWWSLEDRQHAVFRSNSEHHVANFRCKPERHYHAFSHGFRSQRDRRRTVLSGQRCCWCGSHHITLQHVFRYHYCRDRLAYILGARSQHRERHEHQQRHRNRQQWSVATYADHGAGAITCFAVCEPIHHGDFHRAEH